MQFKSSLFGLVALTFAATQANATLWTIDSVLSGSDGGYGYSSFHDSSGSVMSGASYGDINETVISGTYNDVTGEFLATLTVDPTAAGADLLFSLDGTLLFGNDEFLADPSFLAIDFLGENGALADTTLGFMSGDVCCSGNNNSQPGLDPNSFDVSEGILTLWGASGFDGDSSYIESILGMDLRLTMSVAPDTSSVPEPGTLTLLGLGIGLLGFARRKRG